MELIDVITSKENLNRAYKKVVANKGAGGVDGMKVEELEAYIKENKEDIVLSIRNRTYMPKPVRRVYIPKDNGKKRTLGIPTVLGRAIQQAMAQPIMEIYEEIFSDFSYGFRPGRSGMSVVNFILSPDLLENKIKNGAGLLNPLNYYLRNVGI